MGFNTVKAHLVEVAHGGGEGDRLGDRLGAGFEALRGREEVGAFHRDGADHRAAGAERRQRVQQFGAPVEHADAGRAEHFVAGEGGEVHVEGDDVEATVRCRLAGVEHDERADGVGECDELGDRGDESGDVGDVGEGHNPGLLADDGRGVGDRVDAVVVDRDETQGCAGRGGEFLPGHEVGVVFGLGDDDLVACGEREAASGCSATAVTGVGHPVGDEVERVGGVGGPDDLVGLRTDEGGDGLAGVFVGFGGQAGERVRAAVHGRVAVDQEVAFGVEHGQRALRGGAGVEVGERVPVDGLGERGEVGPDPQDVLLGQAGRARAGARRGGARHGGARHGALGAFGSAALGAVSRSEVDSVVVPAAGCDTECLS